MIFYNIIVLYVGINQRKQRRTFSDDNKQQCPNAVLTTFCHHRRTEYWLPIFCYALTYPVMNNTSKNRKPGPSSEVTGVSFADEAKLLLARCLVSLNNIDGPYYYEVIGTASIPGGLSHLLFVTDDQLLMTIYRYCGFYIVKRNCFSETIFQGFVLMG
jgi:hypothetical protein